MSEEVGAALVVTDPVLIHGPVRVLLLGLGQGGLGLSVGLGGIGFENDIDRRELPHLLRVQEAVLSYLMAKSLASHGTIIVFAHGAPQTPLYWVVRRSLVVHAELVDFHLFLLLHELKSRFGLALRYGESGSRPLGRSDLLRLNHRQDQGMQVCDAFQQPGIVLSDYQRLVFFGHFQRSVVYNPVPDNVSECW